MDLSVWYREGGAKAGGKRNPPMEGGLIDRITDLRVQTIIINHCPVSRDAVHRLNKDQPFKWQKLAEYFLSPQFTEGPLRGINRLAHVNFTLPWVCLNRLARFRGVRIDALASLNLSLIQRRY
jgi:hypothetical protein